MALNLQQGAAENQGTAPPSTLVLNPQGQLVCLTVYKRGAVEVVRRLAA
jgi:hypothetical protein